MDFLCSVEILSLAGCTDLVELDISLLWHGGISILITPDPISVISGEIERF